MKSYFAIIERILNEGEPKQATRYNSQGVAEPVENGTVGLSQVYWEHNMSEGFPLLTCRKMPFKSMAVELEGFIKGITSKKWYQERGCKFWDHWTSDIVLEDTINGIKELSNNWKDLPKNETKELKRSLDDLGPLGYSWQWRKFGQKYNYETFYASLPEDHKGIENGFDQLKSIVSSLKNNPYDRRMVCSAWNPNQNMHMALPPCHVLWNVCVYGNKLNLHWHQRSCDTLRGIPNNIASYALLLLLLCAESGLEPGKLSAMFMDCHLYDNDIEHAKELIKLPTYDLPQVAVGRKTEIENGKCLVNFPGIFDWTYKDVELINYQHGPSIKFNAITV